MRKLLILCALAVTGCTCPEKPVIVESLDLGSKGMRQNYRSWIDWLGADPAQRAQLPILTPAQQTNLKAQVDEFEETILLYRSEYAR